MASVSSSLPVLVLAPWQTLSATGLKEQRFTTVDSVLRISLMKPEHLRLL